MVSPLTGDRGERWEVLGVVGVSKGSPLNREVFYVIKVEGKEEVPLPLLSNFMQND